MTIDISENIRKNLAIEPFRNKYINYLQKLQYDEEHPLELEVWTPVEDEALIRAIETISASTTPFLNRWSRI